MDEGATPAGYWKLKKDPTDGATPAAGLMMGSAGNLYGVTEFGGEVFKDYGTGAGTMFEFIP